MNTHSAACFFDAHHDFSPLRYHFSRWLSAVSVWKIGVLDTLSFDQLFAVGVFACSNDMGDSVFLKELDVFLQVVCIGGIEDQKLQALVLFMFQKCWRIWELL